MLCLAALVMIASLIGSFLPPTSCTTLNPPSIILSPENAVTLASITELLSLFSHALDEKDFAALGSVYTDDVVLSSAGNSLTGLAAAQAFYTKTFQNATLKTEHTVTTIYGYNFTATTASSLSYADAIYFGPPVFELGGFFFPNQSVNFREKFQNDYVKQNGSWKIVRQNGPQGLVRWMIP